MLDHVTALRREGGLIAAAVRGTGPQPAADLDAFVPTCPEWTLRELIHHVGRTHHWAAAHVEQAAVNPLSEEESERAWGAMPADADLTAWYLAANARLADALAAAPADLRCWSFLPAPSPLAFWSRRQAHEAAIHRVDAQLAATGWYDTFAADFAADGIDELVCGFYNRGRRLRSDPPRTLAVRAGDGAWLVTIGPEGPRGQRIEATAGDVADCTVTGTASDVYVALWNRADVRGLVAEGDPTVLDLWRDRATVRWS
jgi:uncharacterized protein (TIGR03083 family)